MSRHPRGLYFLFFTDMWEKFSYFGMRAILVFYMTKHLLFEQAYASYVYGIFTGLIYLTPFFGGILTDRFLGRHVSIIAGSALMAVGYFLMMVESLFYPAILLLIIGSGIFTPNISPQANALYKPGDQKCDRAFSILYLGINLGAMFSPLVCGTLGEIYGWHYGFGAAGVGMAIGLATYITGQKYLYCDYHIIKQSIKSIANTCKGNNKRYHRNQNVKNVIEKIMANKNKSMGFLILIILGILFRSVYNQQGNTLALWIDTYTNRHLFGWEIPASWFQALNPLMIILFTPLITFVWNWQARRYSEPSSIMKMALGCIITGISFLLLVIPTVYATQSYEQVNIFWPIACIIILTVGELYIIPTALLLVTKKSPAGMVSMMVGMWYLSYFFGNFLSGFLGNFWEKIPNGYFFFMLSIIAIVAGFGMLIMPKSLKQAVDYDRRLSNHHI